MRNSYTHALASLASLIGSELPVQLGSGPSFCSTPMPQGLSYVHQGHEPANLYIRNIIPIGYDYPTGDPGLSGAGPSSLRLFLILALSGDPPPFSDLLEVPLLLQL
jgi:hypothetical protein